MQKKIVRNFLCASLALLALQGQAFPVMAEDNHVAATLQETVSGDAGALKKSSETYHAIFWQINASEDFVLKDMPSSVPSGTKIKLPEIAPKTYTDSKTGDIYVWDGWYIGDEKYDDKAVVEVTEAVNIEGRWNIQKPEKNFSVNWVMFDENGEEVTLYSDDAVQVNSKSVYKGIVPDKAADEKHYYTFAGWSANKSANRGASEDSLMPVTKDTTYYALFDKHSRRENFCIVTWKNYNGDVININSRIVNASPKFDGKLPTRESDDAYDYSFVGWSTNPDSETYIKSQNLPALKSDITYYAIYEKTPRKYSISWLSNNGHVDYGKSSCQYGESPVPGSSVVPTKASTETEEYKFIGWSEEPNIIVDSADTQYCTKSCTGDKTYYAVFQRIKKNDTVIRWLNPDNSVVQETKIERGQDYSSIKCETRPTYEGSSKYSYTFTSWEEPVVVKDTEGRVVSVTYHAKYTSMPKVPTDFSSVRNSGVVMRCSNDSNEELHSEVVKGSFEVSDWNVEQAETDLVHKDAVKYKATVKLTDLTPYADYLNANADGAIHTNLKATIDTVTLEWNPTREEWVADKLFEIDAESAIYNIKYSYSEDTPTDVMNRYLNQGGAFAPAGTKQTVQNKPTTKPFVLNGERYVFAGWRMVAPEKIEGLTVDENGYVTGDFIMPEADVKFVGEWKKVSN